jgi:hypothetical protein
MRNRREFGPYQPFADPKLDSRNERNSTQRVVSVRETA